MTQTPSARLKSCPDTFRALLLVLFVARQKSCPIPVEVSIISFALQGFFTGRQPIPHWAKLCPPMGLLLLRFPHFHELQIVQALISAQTIDQIFVRALVGDGAVFKDDDATGPAYG